MLLADLLIKLCELKTNTKEMSKMLQYPTKFSVRSTSAAGTQVAWITKAKNFTLEIPMTILPEFAGPGTGFSPEEIYAMAMQKYFIANFKVFAEKSKLKYEGITIESVLEVDRDENKLSWMAQ